MELPNRTLLFLALLFLALAVVATVSLLAVTQDIPDWSRIQAWTVLRTDKDAEWPKLEVNARVIAAVILSSLGACICAAGGVGGGGLFIPIFNLLLQFSTKTSAALSNIMIFGGSLAVLSWNIHQTHPLSNGTKPLIDFDVVLLLNPNMLLGISIGVFCNIMFPGWLLIFVLTIILFYMTNRSVKSGFNRWRKESSKRTVDSGIFDSDLLASQGSFQTPE